MKHQLVFERCKVGFLGDGHETVSGEGREEEIIGIIVAIGERGVGEALWGLLGGCCRR